MKIRNGDTIQMIGGKDRGKTGRVLLVHTASNRVTVEGINVYKKHQRPKKQNEKGEVVTIAKPVHVSSVQLMCAKCGKGARVGFKIEGKTKMRYCKRCGAKL